MGILYLYARERLRNVQTDLINSCRVAVVSIVTNKNNRDATRVCNPDIHRTSDLNLHMYRQNKFVRLKMRVTELSVYVDSKFLKQTLRDTVKVAILYNPDSLYSGTHVLTTIVSLQIVNQIIPNLSNCLN